MGSVSSSTDTKRENEEEGDAQGFLAPALSRTAGHRVSMRLDFPRDQDIPIVQSKSRLASSALPSLFLIKGAYLQSFAKWQD